MSTCRLVATVAGIQAPGASVVAEISLSEFAAPAPVVAAADSAAAPIAPPFVVRDRPFVSADVDVTTESRVTPLVAVAAAARESSVVGAASAFSGAAL